MKKHLCMPLFIFLIALVPLMLSAQEQFLPGYVIRQDGTRSEGLIDYRNWKTNPRTIRFKAAAQAAETKLDALEVREFGVAGERYMGAVVTVDISPLDLDRLSEEDKLIPRTDTVFLQTLIAGSRSLYYYFDAGGRDYFFIGKGDGYELLEMRLSMRTSLTAKNVIPNRKYIGQLGPYLKDCTSLHHQLSNLRYEQADMEKLFQAYYTCLGQRPDFQKKKEKNQVYWGIFAGATLNSLKIKHPTYYLAQADLPGALGPTLGLSLEIFLTRYQQKWSIHNELSYTTYEINATYREDILPGQYTIHELTFRNSYLKLNNLLRYRYPIGKLSCFANLGISNGLALESYNNDKRFIKVFSQEREEEVSPLPGTRKYEQGLIFGLGLRLNRLSAELRHELGNGISDSAVKSISRRNSLLLAYRF